MFERTFCGLITSSKHLILVMTGGYLAANNSCHSVSFRFNREIRFHHILSAHDIEAVLQIQRQNQKEDPEIPKKLIITWVMSNIFSFTLFALSMKSIFTYRLIIRFQGSEDEKSDQDLVVDVANEVCISSLLKRVFTVTIFNRWLNNLHKR